MNNDISISIFVKQSSARGYIVPAMINVNEHNDDDYLYILLTLLEYCIIIMIVLMMMIVVIM